MPTASKPRRPTLPRSSRRTPILMGAPVATAAGAPPLDGTAPAGPLLLPGPVVAPGGAPPAGLVAFATALASVVVVGSTAEGIVATDASFAGESGPPAVSPRLVFAELVEARTLVFESPNTSGTARPATS